MKFGELLNARLLSEWRSQYFQYEVAKTMLAHYKENAPSQEEERPDDFSVSFGRFEVKFFEFTNRELTKINTFFLEKLNEARRKFVTLNSEVDEWAKYKREMKDAGLKPPFFRKLLRKSKDSHDFKIAYSEFYYSIILLQSYQQLNLTAFRKILKKHDKILGINDGHKWRERMVLTADFSSTKAVEELAAECERVVTEKLENGDHKRAIKMLRFAPLSQRPVSSWAVFRVGVMCGYILLLAIFISLSTGWFNCQTGMRSCWRRRAYLENATGDALAEDGDTFWLITIRLHRGIFLVALLIILFGVNIHGCRNAGINHVLLFENDVRDSVSAMSLIELGLVIAATCTMSLLIWITQFYVGYVSSIPLIAIRSISLSYVALLVLFVINPVPIFMYKTRLWLLKSLLRIFSAPFHPVRFADYFVAEQLLSLAVVLQDYTFIGCCAIYGFQPGDVQPVCNRKLSAVYGLLVSLPYWFRFAQCLRSFYDQTRHRRRKLFELQLVNATKYLTTILLLIFRSLAIYWNPDGTTENSEQETEKVGANPFHIIAIFLTAIAIIFWYLWDVKIDWKLFDSKNRFLREQLTYRHSRNYYTCLVVDFVLVAFYWTTLIADIRLTGQQSYEADILLTFVAIFEVFRRFIWNFFRLECEHISNPEKLLQNSTARSAIIFQHHYSMKPLINGEIEDVDRMMILEDGVNEVRKEKRAN